MNAALDQRIELRMPLELKERLDRLALAKGLNLQNYLRLRCTEIADREEKAAARRG